MLKDLAEVVKRQLVKELPELVPELLASMLVSYYEPVTNGDAVTPELVYSMDGDVIMAEVTL